MPDRLFAILCLVASIFVSSCSESENVAGGVSEETNTIAGVLVDLNGDRVSQVAVLARSFKADSLVYSDTTDNDGRFRIVVPRHGLYGLSAKADSLAFYATVDFTGDSSSVMAELEKVSAVESRIELRHDSTVGGIRAYIPGSSWASSTDDDGCFKIGNVPFGNYPLYLKSQEPIQFADAVYIMGVRESGNEFKGPFPVSVIEEWISSGKELDEFVNNDKFASLEKASSSLMMPLSVEFGLRSWWAMDYLSLSLDGTSHIGDARGFTDGILVYGVDSLREGVTEKSLPLNGADEFGVVENDRGILDSATSFTIETWVNVGKVSSGEFRRNIVGKLGFGGADDADVFSLALVDGVCGVEEISIGFFIADGMSDSLGCEDAVFSVLPSFDEWVYVAAVWDGENLMLYVNGQLMDSSKVSVHRIGISEESIFFGKENLNLKLDNVRISTTAVSESDVIYRFYQIGEVL